LSPVQSLLQYAGEDPGTVDGKDGPKTQAAVKSFQGKNGLGETGNADEGTRKTLYKKFMDDSNALDLKAKDFDSIDGAPTCGCSEFNPLEKTEGKSETNRRVTVLFLKSNKNFPINYPCKKGSIVSCQAQVKKKPGVRRRPSYGCFFYDDLIKEEKKGGKLEITPPGKLKLLGVKEGDEVKQFVNMKAGVAGQGPDRLIEAEAGGADGAKVFWKITATKENSKRNSPKAGAKPDDKGKLTEFKDGIAEIETVVKGGKTSFVLVCGMAGGDKFTVEAGMEKGKAGSMLKVVTWRKSWYQVTLEKGLALPALANFIKAYELAFVKTERTKDVEFEKKDAPARTFYPEWMVKKGGGDKEVAVIGSHNKAHYQTLLKDVTGEEPKAHFVICQHQWDEGVDTKLIVETMKSNPSAAFKATLPLFNPPLSGNLVTSGKWTSTAPAGHADNGKTGKLTDADILMEKGRGGLSEFKVKLPAGSPDPAIHGVKVELILRGVDGPYLGESSGKQILAVYNPADPTDFQNTLTHEMGHTFNQTPDPKGQSPGLPDHPHQYRKHGGTGPHCSTILKAGKEEKGVEKEIKNPDGAGKIKIYETGVCVMFHSGPEPGCLNRYCDTCLPYVKATDFSEFGKA
nr:peptidoglycan-binding protein [Fibrobacterota bacterium]